MKKREWICSIFARSTVKKRRTFWNFQIETKCGVFWMQRERLQTQPRHRIFTMGSPILDRAESLKFPFMEFRNGTVRPIRQAVWEAKRYEVEALRGRNFTIWRIPKDPVSSSAIKEVKSNQTNGDTSEPPVESQQNLSCLLFLSLPF